jgi:cell wall-associated NlpC family hydrolase
MWRTVFGTGLLSLAVPTIAHAQTTRAAILAADLGPSLVAQRVRVDGPDVVRTARQYVGVPYRMGGATPRAFDCSGFVRYVFAEHGIALPRTAHEQAALGEAPSAGDTLVAGDLLFFYGGKGAQHVAMYVGGDSIIHASSVAHQIRYDRLSGNGVRRTWFHQRLIAVRRVLPLQGLRYASIEASSAYSAIAAERNAEW